MFASPVIVNAPTAKVARTPTKSSITLLPVTVTVPRLKVARTPVGTTTMLPNDEGPSKMFRSHMLLRRRTLGVCRIPSSF